MPLPSTMTPILTITLSSDSSTVDFSSIPQTYTDLMIVQYARSTNAASTVNSWYRFNSDSGSNYSVTRLQGDGSSVVSNRGGNQTVGYISYVPGANAAATEFSANNIYIFNYSNTNIFKTSIGTTSAKVQYVATFAGLWRSTSAVTTITLGPDAGNWKSGSTFTLYGIKAAS